MPSSLTFRSFRILVVEDSQVLSEVMVDLLTDRGANCTAYASADDAMIAVLNGYRPDLLITDHILPGQLKGAELADMLATRFPGLPTVITTGYGYEIRAGLPKSVIYLQKPWMPDALLTAIHQSLSSA